MKPGVFECGADTITALAYRRIGESDDRELRESAGDVDLDIDQVGVKAYQRHASHFSQHESSFHIRSRNYRKRCTALQEKALQARRNCVHFDHHMCVNHALVPSVDLLYNRAMHRAECVCLLVFCGLVMPVSVDSQERTPSGPVGASMALLATLQDAGILPPEGTPQANRIIQIVIQ